MKKVYAKPQLYAESFELVEHISAGCGVMANFGGDCPLQVDNDPTYFTTEPGCHPDAISMLEFAGYQAGMDPVKFLIEKVDPTCYNSLVDFHQMFIS